MEYQPFADEPGYSGDWGALPGHLNSQVFSHRNFLSTLRFNLLLLFSFLQAKNKKKKKGTKTLGVWSFTQEMKLKPLTRQRSSTSGSAGDVQKEEVAKWWTSSGRAQLCKTDWWNIDFHIDKNMKLCSHYGIYLLSCSWCQVLACTAGQWHVLFNPRTALALSPAAAPSSQFPWLPRATHCAPGGHLRRNTTMSYRLCNGHYLIKNN